MSSRKRIFRVNDVLFSESGSYLITKFLGEGVYGQVVECIHQSTGERVAVKILPRHLIAENEVCIFQQLQSHLEKNNNLVRLTDHFTYIGHVCLAFEMLDISLQDLLRRRFTKPMSLSEIRVVTQQMLVALKALKSVGVAHADIKPDNIMMVDHKSQPLKLKLIDFGLAMPVSEMRRGMLIQSCAYRAPEVILGLPLNEAVDMWSLGCVLAFMYLGRHLFAYRREFEIIEFIMQAQDQPDMELLDLCKLIRGANTQPRGRSWTFTSFDDVLKVRPEADNPSEHEDRMAFLSLLKRMLHMDSGKRITPSDALRHRFVTMEHLTLDIANNDSNYTQEACLVFEKSQLEESSLELKSFVTSSERRSWYRPFSSSFHASLADEEINTTANTRPAGIDERVADGPRDTTTTTADGTAADNDDGPPATAGVDETTAAGTDKNPPGTSEAPSRACVKCKSDGNNTRCGEDEGKTKNWFQRQFSKMSCFSDGTD